MIINILLWVVPVLLIINFQTRQMWISFKMQDLFQLNSLSKFFVVVLPDLIQITLGGDPYVRPKS